MNIETYLQRIDYHGPRQPTVEILKQLHKAQMYSVPFENLDIPLGRPIVLSLPLLFEKIVQRWRGGFCYELNALFGWLLREIGFKVEMLSARVFDNGVDGPEFDHMLLLVEAGETFIADVGFGESFINPLRLCHEEQPQYGSSYRLEERDEDWVLHQWTPESEWEPQYVFTLEPRQLDDFHAMCHYHQTSPESHFTRKSVCSLATREGRITLSNGRLIVTSSGHRQEWQVASVDEYQALLKKHFGVELGDDVDSNILLQPNSAHR